MPYIPVEQRGKFDEPADRIGEILNGLPENELAGSLNYAMTRILWQLCGHGVGKRRYARMNAVIGAVECAKLEMYRRVVALYEDEKIQSAGDVAPRTSSQPDRS